MKRLLAAAVLVLGACQTTDAQTTASKEELGCVVLGFKPGTEAFGNCVLQTRSIQAQEMNARANALGASQAAQQNIINQMKVTPKPVYRPGQ